MPRAATAPKKPDIRRKPPAEYQVPPDNDGEGDELFEGIDWEVQATANELSQEEGASVTIYRQGVHGRDLKFIDTLPPANFSMVMLKHPPYNGGKFRIQMRNARGELVVNRLQEVEPGPKEEPTSAAPPPPVAPAFGGEAFVLIAKAMTDGFAKLGELIVANRPEPVKPRTTEEILNELKLMRDVFAPAPTSAPSQNDMLETFTKFMELSQRFGGGGDGGGAEPTAMGVLLELARQFGPQLRDAMAQNEQARIPSDRDMPPRVVGPVAHPPQPGGEQPPQQQRRTDVNLLIKQQLRFLVHQASRNNDPEPYAVVVLDNVPPPILNGFLARDDWFDELCKFAPEAKPYKGWFEQLKGHIDEYLTSEPDDAQTPPDETQQHVGGASEGADSPGVTE